jgi:hypothetical protein
MCEPDKQKLFAFASQTKWENPELALAVIKALISSLEPEHEGSLRHASQVAQKVQRSKEALSMLTLSLEDYLEPEDKALLFFSLRSLSQAENQLTIEAGECSITVGYEQEAR